MQLMATKLCHNYKLTNGMCLLRLEKTPDTVMPLTRVCRVSPWVVHILRKKDTRQCDAVDQSVSPWVVHNVRQEIPTIMVFCFAARWNSNYLTTQFRLWTRPLSFYSKIVSCLCFVPMTTSLCNALYYVIDRIL